MDDADQRSVERLAELSKTTGCGEGGREDCYPCLKVDNELSEALTQAQTRPAPNPYAQSP